MESQIIINATIGEMNDFFNENSVCLVKYFEGIGTNKFEAIIRHCERKAYLQGTYTIPQLIFKLQLIEGPIRKNEKKMFFSQRDNAELTGAIGYLRGFFNSEDKLNTSWFDFQPNLKTKQMQTELDGIMDFLQSDSEYPILKSYESMKDYYDSRPEWGVEGSICGKAYGIKLRTDRYSYYARFVPITGDYNVYIFAYDNRRLRHFLESDE